MGSASFQHAGHRGGPERVQLTVAELLGRCGTEGAGRDVGRRSRQVESVPEGWPSGGGSVRRRLAAAAGTLVVAGSFAAGAVLSGPPGHGGGPMGAESAGAGHPVEVPRATPPRAAATEPQRRVVTPLARVVPVRPAVRQPVRRSKPPAVVRPDVRDVPDTPVTRDIPDEGTVRAPAGSALSGLTPAIGPVEAVDSLLGGLIR